MNGKEYRCALHHRGQDPEETKRWKKQRARSWWDERLSRANYQRKLSDHTCSNKQLVEETITSQTGDTWPHRIKNVRRDAVPSETGKTPPCWQKQTWRAEQASRLRELVYVFVDECGYNIWTARSHGRARQGERAYRQVCSQRGRNLTVTMAVSPISTLVFSSAAVGGMSKLVDTLHHEENKIN